MGVALNGSALLEASLTILTTRACARVGAQTCNILQCSYEVLFSIYKPAQELTPIMS